MEARTSLGSIIKRLNLLFMILVALGSIAIGVITARELHSDAVYEAGQDHWADIPPTKAELELAQKQIDEKYANAKFDPDKYLEEKAKEEYLAKMSDAKLKRLYEVSWLMPSIKGVGVAFLIFVSFAIFMSTVSWLLGYGWKIHLSSK